MLSSRKKTRVAISMGDPSGIGPAIASRAIERLRGLAKFIIIGDRWVFEKASGKGAHEKDCEFVDLGNVGKRNFSFGKIRPEYGRASVEYLDKALELIKTDKANCLVTCPLCKESVNLSGLSFSGHTEYLAAYAGIKDYVMMLLNKRLKFSLVTRHIPLKDVSANIDGQKLRLTILETHRALKILFGLRSPRLVVCGLNPHASDNAVIGEEENKIIKPQLLRLRKQVSHLNGPLAADVAIAGLAAGKFDCAIALYHDQALIPLKLSDNKSGVNMTLGLPFIRTSPLHGTAFDIAARPELADPSSLIEAIRLAVKCNQALKA
jgi:4-hydroxythreonine-4-phosphate dehydrogenase